MFNFGGIATVFFGWAKSLFFWAIITILAIGGIALVFYLDKRRRLNYAKVLVLTQIGSGKVTGRLTQAGWFRPKKIFFGLVDMGGEARLETAEGKLIQDASERDFQYIDGRRFLFVYQKEDDPQVLVPITNVKIEGQRMLAEIAPASYRDAAIRVLNKLKEESLSWLEKNSATIVSLSIFMIGIVALIIIFHFAQQESAAWRETAVKVFQTLKTHATQTSAP